MSEREQLEQAIATLEAQRMALGDAVVDAAVGPMREKLARLTSPPTTELSGERKVVTILLVDVKGSTDLAEQLNMETWVEVMDRLFRILQAEVYRFGGEVNQFRGDGLLAFFGASGVREDDPERAVLAALEMLSAIQPYAAELAEREGVALQLRVGVNTGEVIVTQVGDHRYHSEGTAMGRAVALAARMESSAEPGSVLVSEHTYRLVRPLFTWESLGKIIVKGIHEPVAVYRPLTHRVVPGQRRGFAGLASPLVGRQAEFAALQRAIKRLRDGQGGVVTLAGEAGLGKSRLVAEVQQWVLAHGPSQDGPTPELLQWVEGRCVSYDTNSAYVLWLDVLRGLLGMVPEDSLEQVQLALRERVAALCPDIYDDVYPHLQRLLSLSLDAEPDGDEASRAHSLTGERLRQEIFHALAQLLKRAAQHCPMVLVCEDLHWADPSSLALLKSLFPLLPDIPLLLICLFRPERALVAEGGPAVSLRAAAASQGASHTDLRLVPLDAVESESLIYNLLHADLPASLKARILAYAEGNPFYVEEILRALMADGAIVYDVATGGWQATREVEAIAIPETLHGVLMARIDRLPPQAKRLLQLAAVVGRIFSRHVLEVLLRRCEALALADEALLEQQLDILQHAELIRERPRKMERSYIFKHHLTQQAAYNSVLVKERQVWHKHVAEALKQVYADQLWQHAALLAHHWERTDEAHHAIPHLIRAASQATSRFANAEALSILDRALTLARSTKLSLAEADVLYRVSYVLGRQGDYAGARSALEQALPIYQTFSNQRRVGMLLSELGWLVLRQGAHAEAQAYFEQTVHITNLVGNRRGEAMAFSDVGNVYLERAMYTKAQASFEQGLRLSRRLRYYWGEAEALLGLGYVAHHLGDLAKADAHDAHALRLFRRYHNRYGMGRAHIVVAWLRCVQRNLAEAQEHARAALDIFEEMGNLSGIGDALVALGYSLVLHDEGEVAEPVCQRALSLRQDLGERHLLVEPMACLAAVAFQRGDMAGAMTQVEALLPLLKQYPKLEGIQVPFWIYKMCYQALQSAQDARAEDIIHAAQDLLYARAANIVDTTQRAAFMAYVKAQYDLE